MTKMIAHLVFTKDTPSQAQMEVLAKDLERLRVRTNLVEADSRDGIRLVELYELFSRPAIALVKDDGSIIERWQHNLPTASEVSYLAHS